MTNSNLKTLQEWMQTLLTNRGNFQQKLFLTEAQFQLNAHKVIAQRQGLDAHARLRVYATGYVLRLLECLRADYPLLQAFMTDSVFNTFGQAYIEYHPSSSFTLFDLGANFPAFLAATRPQNIPENQAAAFDFPYALALYERACLDVLRAKGLEGQLYQKNFSTFSNFLFEHERNIQAASCLVCLELDYPVLSVVQALKNNEIPEVPNFQKNYLALTRIQYRLKVMELTDWQYHFLMACKTTTTVMEALNYCHQKTRISVSELLAELMFFIPMAYDSALLMEIEAI